MAYTDEGGDGVGGWLSVFVVMIGLFSPLRVLIELVSLYGSPEIAYLEPAMWTQLQLLTWAVAILTVAGCWYIVWLLFNRQVWRTVPRVIALLWTIAVGGGVVQFAGVSLITGIPVGLLLREVRPHEWSFLLLCVLWTAYFLKSKRVANTYEREPGDEGAAPMPR